MIEKITKYSYLNVEMARAYGMQVGKVKFDFSGDRRIEIKSHLNCLPSLISWGYHTNLESSKNQLFGARRIF